MNLEKLKEITVTMYSALLNSRIPEKHKLHMILIAVSNDGDYMPMTHGIGCNNIIGILSSDILGDGPGLRDLQPICERLAIYLRSTNIAQEAGIHFMLYVITEDYRSFTTALFGLKPITARGVAARAAISVNQAVLDMVKIQPQVGEPPTVSTQSN